MELQHQFTVPTTVDDAWKVLLDVPRIAPCMPGASLDEFDGTEFSGSVRVKLGPISLLYKGTGRFTETDESAHRIVMEASGKESRGSGTAAATVTAVLTGEGERTRVDVTTDLRITGRPAQFGRGMLDDVGGKLLGQFADCLATTLSGSPTAEDAAASTAGAGGTDATPSSGSPGGAGAASSASGASAGSAGTHAPGTASSGTHDDGVGTKAPGAASSGSAASAGSEGGTREATAGTAENQAQAEPEPIDLLQITGAQDALRRYGPYALAGLLAAGLLWLVLRRRSR